MGRLIPGQNDLKTQYPSLAEEWACTTSHVLNCTPPFAFAPP